jgi:hypothetical protein
MTTEFAEAFKDLIASLPFVDRLAGMVRPVTFKDTNKDGAFVRRSFPVACGVSAKDCINNGKYQDLVPNDTKKSVLYFEEIGGAQVIGREKNNLKFRATMRLVGWLNLQKLGVDSCSYSSAAVLQIISRLPEAYFNLNDRYTKCFITNLQEADKLPTIFGRYTYDETVTQYLLFPYDYFALNITVEYNVPRACIEAIVLDEPINCPSV